MIQIMHLRYTLLQVEASMVFTIQMELQKWVLGQYAGLVE